MTCVYTWHFRTWVLTCNPCLQMIRCQQYVETSKYRGLFYAAISENVHCRGVMIYIALMEYMGILF